MAALLPAFAGLSSLANPTILSTAGLFLVAGFLLGDGAFGLVHLRPDDDVIATFAGFGLKSFASVVYGLLVLASGIAAAEKVFQLVAVTIILSILLHSSTRPGTASPAVYVTVPGRNPRVPIRRRAEKPRTKQLQYAIVVTG
ncbi:hypothetical protein [Herbidospora daliensis]|uniref:hypothetical protein n=1 Tax=Herbidospora daliensis TaxID=295585 RepID=UPI000AB972B2|nr:hypothetical protein [Herbidospora daliensis]